MKIDMDRIAITGMGVISPLGNNLKDYWDNLINGRCGIRTIKSFDVTGLPTRIGGEVDNFSPTDYMDLKTAKRCARFTQFALAAVEQAIRDAGLCCDEKISADIGVYVGSSTCSLVDQENLIRLNYKAWPIFASVRDCNHSTAYTIAGHYNLTGPTFTLTSACNSSSNAIEVAIDQLRLSKISKAIIVGAEALSHFVFRTLSRSQTMSKRNEVPEKASRPFDRERDGFVVSEGAGAIILEKLSDGSKRGKRPYAVISGCASTNDGFSIYKCEPYGQAISTAMEKALNCGRRCKDEVSYISAHGPSMPDTDLAETRAIKRSFGARSSKLQISSIKGALGSPLGATNILQVIAGAKSIAEAVIPPTINLEYQDAECNLDYVPKEARDLTINCAIINSHAYGGGNSSVVLEQI